MDQLPLTAIVGAALAAGAAFLFVLMRWRSGGEAKVTGGVPASVLSAPSVRTTLPPRPSLRPSASPPSFRESLRNVFTDPALNAKGIGFGKKCEWVVAKTSTAELARALGLEPSETLPWREALRAAVEGKCVAFLGPVDEFSFAVAEPGTFRIEGAHILDDTNVFSRVADSIGREVFFFQSDPRAEGFAWLRARPGLVERAFSVIDTHTLADEGPQDEIEEQVRGQRPVPEGEEWWPTEEDVLEISTGWSTDTWALDDKPLGDLPCLVARPVSV